MNFKFNYTTQADTSDALFQQKSLEKNLESLKKLSNRTDLGFWSLTENQDLIEQTKTLHQKIKHKKHFVQIGIGGSALGPQMLVSSLAKPSEKSFSLIDNIDADHIHDTLACLDLEHTIFYVVSKSGGTAETIAGYIIARNLLLDSGIPSEKLTDYFVFCTDPKSGQLREHVEKNNYRSVEVPSNIGGRFSVLTPVGLLPALFMGIKIEALFQGANLMKASLLTNDLSQNNILQTAAHLMQLYQDKAVDQTVLMPYSSKLKDFSAWFVQLWAESLGKMSHEQGRAVGLTPIAAYGATDQHSQMQLFMEGPSNKLLFLMNIKERVTNYSLDNNLDLTSAKMLHPFKLNELMLAEYLGSAKALQENDKNLIEIELESLDEEHLGGLILFFESLTALMGELLLVDAFNQPGVEKGKKYAFEFLNSLKN